MWAPEAILDGSITFCECAASKPTSAPIMKDASAALKCIQVSAVCESADDDDEFLDALKLELAALKKMQLKALYLHVYIYVVYIYISICIY